MSVQMLAEPSSDGDHIRPFRCSAMIRQPPARVVQPVFRPNTPGVVPSILLWFTQTLAYVGAAQRVR